MIWDKMLFIFNTLSHISFWLLLGTNVLYIIKITSSHYSERLLNRGLKSEMTFGAFISIRRKERKVNLREAAKNLSIAYGYLSDIEQGRRPAPEGAFVERMVSFLELDKQEYELLLDLAAKSRKTVSADLLEYIMERDVVRAALRVAKEVDATDEEWQAFMETLKNRQR